ncbi:MAG: UbiA family prenyltransferase [Chthonomonadaceae bacterium]|nr:UbiA family prenyltransferase [Chthonomonadaceae bacterium]
MRRDFSRSFIKNLKQFGELVKIEHTIFALPFALISMLLASKGLPHGLPPLFVILWIIVAMVGARSAAMAFNRLADRAIDAANPRTASRHIPAGLVSVKTATLYFVVSVVVFAFASWSLSPLCLMLSPVALAVILGYSLAKRFTPLCHLILGFGIGIAPIGAWIAVRGDLATIPLLLGAIVMLWIGGFGIIYALQDYDFDRANKVYSIPAKVGKAKALMISRLMHVIVIALLFTVGVLAHLGFIYFVGACVVTGLIIYEQSIVKPNDLSRVNMAFFTLNGWVSVLLFLFTALDGIIYHPLR